MVIAVKLALLEALTTDPELQALLGGTAEDLRVAYFFSPVTADALSPAQPAYIVYKMLSKGELLTGARAAHFRLDVWGIGPDLVMAVRERLEGLLEKRIILTADGHEIFCKFVNEADLFDEVGNLSGLSIDLRLGWPYPTPVPRVIEPWTAPAWIEPSWIEM